MTVTAVPSAYSSLPLVIIVVIIIVMMIVIVVTAVHAVIAVNRKIDHQKSFIIAEAVIRFLDIRCDLSLISIYTLSIAFS